MWAIAAQATLHTVDYPKYDPQSPITPLTPAEIGALDQLLQTLPADAVMTLDGLDGYLTALLVSPSQPLAKLPTEAWLPLIWGGDHEGGHEVAAPFASKRQRKATVVLVLRHLRHLSDQLTRSPDDWEPIFSVAEKGADEWVDARDWCAGFLQAVDLQPEEWRAVWADPDLGAAMASVLQLGGGLEGDDDTAASEIDDAKEIDALSRAVPDAVLLLLDSRG